MCDHSRMVQQSYSRQHKKNRHYIDAKSKISKVPMYLLRTKCHYPVKAKYLCRYLERLQWQVCSVMASYNRRSWFSHALWTGMYSLSPAIFLTVMDTKRHSKMLPVEMKAPPVRLSHIEIVSYIVHNHSQRYNRMRAKPR